MKTSKRECKIIHFKNMNKKKVFYYCIRATNYISFSHSSNNYVTTNVKPSKETHLYYDCGRTVTCFYCLHIMAVQCKDKQLK